MNLVDTSGWIEYFFDGGNATFFSEPIENIDRLIVPVICIYEVFKKITSTVDESHALRAVAQMKQGHLIPIDEEIALKAALSSIRYGLPMADSLIYATGLIKNALVWTQDADFQGLPGVQYRGKPD